jgi:hypothetical protein
MRTPIKYISLLLICGLMFIFYHRYTYIKGKTCKVHADQLKTLVVKNKALRKFGDQPFPFLRDVWPICRLY